MLSESVVYQDDHIKADLTAHAADERMNFARWREWGRADADANSLTVSDYLLRRHAFPDLSATLTGTLELNGSGPFTLDRQHRLDFATYKRIPDALLVQLEDAVYAVNPNWRVLTQEEEAADTKKAATDSTGD